MRLSSRTMCFVAGLALLTAAGELAAQQRREVGRSEPEAQLMGYYASLMSFRTAGLPDRGGRLLIGAAATWMPELSLEDRTVGFGGTQSWNANLCSAVPRIVVAKGFGRIAAEVGGAPTASACGGEAGLLNAALSYRFPFSPAWDGLIRVSGFSGFIKAPITCSSDMIADPLNQTCYGGTLSTDEVRPAGMATEFVAAFHGWANRLEPYLLAGVRYERVDFDVNYTRTAAQGLAVNLPALDDHDRLQTTLARVHLAAGGTLALGNRFRLGSELFYAPGAVFTLSGSAAILIGRSR